MYDYKELPVDFSFDLEPQTALDYFRQKGLKSTFNWQEMLDNEHDKAFTVAKMMDLDLLQTVQDSLSDAMEVGKDFKQWQEELTPRLQEAGWWGEQEIENPQTGIKETVQTGSASRLETIYRTNMQASYSAGQWQQIQEQKEIAPYLMYSAIDDDRVRPEHLAWNNLILPADDEFWDSHMPPNGWNCRCSVIQLSEDEIEEMGLEISSQAPKNANEGLDKGWDKNSATSQLNVLKQTQQEKLNEMTKTDATASRKGIKATQNNN